jgi:hypothetical protein
MALKFNQLLAKYVTGNIPAGKRPEVAITGISEGLTSDSLYILAGLSKNENTFEIEHYLALALNELQIIQPDKKQAALEYALAITEEVIEGSKDLIIGIKEIKNQAIDSYDFYTETKEYVYDSIGFESLYGLYVTYDDLTDINPPLKSDLASIEDVKEEMFDELKKWQDKLTALLEINSQR